MLQGTCLSSVLQALGRTFSTVTLKIMNVAAAESTPLEPGSTDETMNLQDEDNSPSCDESILDEDPNEEVAEEDVLAEVKLTATIRQLR